MNDRSQHLRMRHQLQVEGVFVTTGTSAIDRNKIILGFSFIGSYMRVACMVSRLYASRPFLDLATFLLCDVISSPRIYFYPTRMIIKLPVKH